MGTASLAQWLSPQPREWQIRDVDSRFRRGDLSVSNYISDSKLGTPVAALPGTWRYGVSVGTGWPVVSTLQLGEVESLICNFCLGVAACAFEQIRPRDTLACQWDVTQLTIQRTSWYCTAFSLLP